MKWGAVGGSGRRMGYHASNINKEKNEVLVKPRGSTHALCLFAPQSSAFADVHQYHAYPGRDGQAELKFTNNFKLTNKMKISN